MLRCLLMIARIVTVLMLMLALAVLVLPARAMQSVPQVVLTVNSSADPGDGTCDAVECTLREAIRAANSVPGADTVLFAIPGAGPHTIRPTSALPVITDTVTIDGASQPGFIGIPVIELDGTNAGQFADGLRISAGNSTVRSLTINRFNLVGIRLYTDGGNAIVGNFIGTDTTGAVALPNRGSGIVISDVMSNTIGGVTGATSNLISGNGLAGIEIVGDEAAGNQILGNTIGTNLAGNAALSNRTYGILLDGAPGNIVGGTAAGALNLISGNELSGVYIANEGAAGNTVLGNLIGTDGAGRNAIPNRQGGVAIFNAADNFVGGTTDGSRNVLSGNESSGVQIIGEAALRNRVVGNFIGTDINGSAPLSNGYNGVSIENAADNIIGGAESGARNVISSNENNGVEITGDPATGNQIVGNYIGTDGSGTNDLGNGTQGVFLHGGTSDNTVGGSVQDAGNLVSGNNGTGIYIEGATTEGNLVLGNIIGADATGTSSLGNSGNGVLLSDTGNNVVGGTVSAELNLISGNQGAGVRIIGVSSNGNQVLGNRIGTDISGTGALGNDGSGLSIDNALNNIIGGVTAEARNLISGNNGRGIVITGASARNNQVLGNYIGTDVSGSAALGNGQGGVLIDDAIANMIGGSVPGSRNLISGNDSSGVNISGINATDNRIEGNFIGTNSAGTASLSNSVGVFISSASGTVVGGGGAATRNVISGNERSGVYIFGSSARENRVIGNYIGVDESGASALGNGTQGVYISAAISNTIGGIADGSANVISGNGGTGVYIAGNGPTNNQVLGNHIGTDARGRSELGNGGSGVLIEGASDNIVGGLIPGAGNTIAFNGGDGISVGVGTRNGLLSNRIFSNDALGIDLAPGGVTPNDPGDTDNGSNLRQNFPILTAASGEGSTVTVTGALTTTLNATVRIQFFANDSCDPLGYGEGQQLLNREPLTVTTDGNGVASFVTNFPANLGRGQIITATATDAENNTSEFSPCIPSTGQSILPAIYLPLAFKEGS